jgi:hypothetical protein
MKLISTLCTILLTVLLFIPPVFADQVVIGSIKNAQGDTFVVRDGSNIAATKGLKLFQNDILLTEDASSMGIVLRDDTLISLGSNTEIAINEFKFAPAKGELFILTRMVRGIVTYISGQITKLSPESARFETPTSTIGVRGTKFLVKVDGS